MFTTKDVADYYNTTLEHYEIWWNLKKSLSLHYGIWDEDTRNFQASLVNTNKVLSELAEVTSSDSVLDAGCGVGGSSMFLADTIGCQATGITLSEKQIAYGQKTVQKRGLTEKVEFHKMDYTATTFESGSFDVVWACESMSHAADKTLFLKEMFRVLKKGGRLIISDFFMREEDQQDPDDLMKKWGDTWGISQFPTGQVFIEDAKAVGFRDAKLFDYTEKIVKSARRMYCASLLGSIPSEAYNFLHPKVSRFARTHYRSGYYQYKALNKDLWKYQIVLGVK